MTNGNGSIWPLMRDPLNILDDIGSTYSTNWDNSSKLFILSDFIMENFSKEEFVKYVTEIAKSEM